MPLGGNTRRQKILLHHPVLPGNLPYPTKIIRIPLSALFSFIWRPFSSSVVQAVICMPLWVTSPFSRVDHVLLGTFTVYWIHACVGRCATSAQKVVQNAARHYYDLSFPKIQIDRSMKDSKAIGHNTESIFYYTVSSRKAVIEDFPFITQFSSWEGFQQVLTERKCFIHYEYKREVVQFPYCSAGAVVWREAFY